MKRTVLAWSFGVAGLLFAAFIGLWSKSLFTISESMHFSVNFPAGEGIPVAEKMSCCDLGTPWERAFGSEWSDYPTGGVLVWGTEGQLLLDVGQEGWLKRLFQPRFINLSSHWIRNVGVRPYRIRLAMDLCDIDLEWETFEAKWDQATLSSTRYIEPGETFNMDWYFRIPAEMMQRSVICRDGKMEVFDAETEEQLSSLPITILNTRNE